MPIFGAFLACVAAIVYVAYASEQDVQCGGAGQFSCQMQDDVASGAGSIDGEGGDVEDVGLLHLRTSQTLQTKQACQGDVCQKCISDASAYKDLWESYAKPGYHKHPGCVSPELFGSVHEKGSDTLYPENAEKAWIVSKVDLEQFLYLQWKFGRTPAKVSAAALVIIGFGPPALDQDVVNQSLAVFKLPQGPAALKDGMNLVPTVPVFAWWFYQMSTAGYFVDYATQKRITVAYSHVSWQNVLDVFSRLTGCSVASLKVQNLTEAWWWSGCSASSMAVYNTLQDTVEEGTGCVRVFWANEHKRWSLKNAGDVRMMLWMCYDVNPYNTGIGLGWNSYPNPLVCKLPSWQTNYDHYTGEEYVIDNVHFGNFTEHVDIDFADAPAVENKKLIQQGFC